MLASVGYNVDMPTAATPTTVKLVPHEKGAMLVLDPALLREAGIDPDEPVLLSMDGGRLIITSAIVRPTPEQVDQAMANVNREWGDVLRKLAE